VADHFSIEGLNDYEQATLAKLFTEAGLDADVTFKRPVRDAERPGAMEAWTALVDIGQPTLAVVAAWILKSRRKITRIKKPDGTVIEHSQESFVSRGAADLAKTLRRELGQAE